MKYNLLTANDAHLHKTDGLIIGIYKNRILSPVAKQLDKASKGKISKLLKLTGFSGKEKQLRIFHQVKGVMASHIICVGCGKKESFDLDALETAIISSAKLLKPSHIYDAISYLVDLFDNKETSQQALRQSIINHANIFYRFDQYKSKKSTKPKLKTLHFAVTQKDQLTSAFKQGVAIAKGMKFAKNLANSPSNICTPSYLADTAKKLSKKYQTIDLEILEEADMEKLGMEAFLSVSKGSIEPGKLLILHYHGADKDQVPYALVGKGITFDSGGISLKPGASMDEMKYDMGGGASVFGTIKACAEMQLPINIIAIIAAAENMPAGNASKPGDIVTSMSGQTIEILNTDAEGRLVLCDALTYIKKYKPVAVIDIATLTGACIVALGHHISGMISNNQSLANTILQAGEAIKDEVWSLPMNKKYDQQLHSNFADMANIGGRAAGTITAACFLARFTKAYHWAHLDIAGTAWKSGQNKGSTGRPVPLLSQVLINYAQKIT